MLDLAATLGFATSTAREAGSLLRDIYHRRPQTIDYKGIDNLVTEADHASEELIAGRIRSRFPDHSILAEEGRNASGSAGLMWVIDPLDGTNNFAHGFPVFAVSIGLQDAHGPLIGVVYDPLRDECFCAARGQGATLNNKPIRGSDTSRLQQSLLATGFPYNHHAAQDNNTVALAAFLRRCQCIRRAGSAALDLAYVACGRLDGYWEQQLGPWDVAAGHLLVQEAGGRVTGYSGHEDHTPLQGSTIVASNGHIHDEMLDVLRSVYVYSDEGVPALQPRWKEALP
jgi:myo-inositol-1(or 4)-monophosphatase